MNPDRSVLDRFDLQTSGQEYKTDLVVEVFRKGDLNEFC